MFSKVLYFAVFAACLDKVLGHGQQQSGSSSQYFNRHDTFGQAGGAGGFGGHGGFGQNNGYGNNHGHGSFDSFAEPKYDFGYDVENPQTGDIKSQHEHRDGGHVKGHYELHQPDGSVRHVEYHGDEHSGFNADVQYSTHHETPRSQGWQK